MVLPVYVLFTKCDLVAGFVEYFDDLKRSERGQAWGATFALSEDKSNPAGLFDREFDVLVQHLHQRTLLRMGSDRPTRDQKERVYQFPLEFAAIKRNLSDFMGAAFKPAPQPTGRKAKAIQTPILRGFYFTSGTQEGKPLDRVVGAMGRAFGLRPVEKDDEGIKESKSFFLKEVFTGIIFPDQDIAGRTQDEVSRVRWQRIAVAAGTAIVASVLMIPAIFSYLDNQELIDKTDTISKATATINWDDGQSAVAKIDQLDQLREHLEQLDQWNQEGAPISMRWGMYMGDELFGPALDQYIASLNVGFIQRVKVRLETKLANATGARFLEDYNYLKTYLLLNDIVHLQKLDRWQIGRLTQEWAEILRPSTVGENVTERDLRDKIVTHVSYYVDLLRRGVVKGEELDQALIQSVRDRLSRIGSSQRYYDQFVTVLEDAKIDETGPNTPDNLAHPPITLNQLFEDRPDALTKLSSKRKRREGKWQKVRGPYTASGHAAVLANLKDGFNVIEREQWVLPITGEEKDAKALIKRALERVRQDYDAQYIREWTEFFRDVDVAIPQNNIEAIEEFRVLSTPDWPYWRLLRALRDNTQFDLGKKKDDLLPPDAGVVEQIKRRVKRRIDSRVGAQGATDAVGDLGLPGTQKARKDPVPEKFKLMVQFGFPTPPKEGEPPPPSGLSHYVGQLEELAGEMTVLEEGPVTGDTVKATELFETAVADTEKKILTLDRFGQELLRDLLMNPLRQSYTAMVKSAGGAASGLWEVEVWPPYRDTIKNRYPFNKAARRDASYDDAVAFFTPKTGLLWGFYENYLKSYHRQVKHQFIPNTALAGTPRPSRRFTPFNPQMYNCLERAHEISDALFSQGAAEGEPGVKFRVNLTTVSPIVSEIEFELDGQRRLYRNEREFWHSFVWPGPEEGLTGASIIVRGAGGLNEEIRRDGPWGMWRLLDAGRRNAIKENDRQFVVEWEMAAPPITVKMQMKPTRANHPFPRAFFRDTNCPPSIGDTFGPG